MHNTAYAAYRLHPRDLDEQRTATIRRVTYEGVEALRPVLHFEGVAKPLVLSVEQGRALMRLTGESLCERWIGHEVTLSPAEDGILIGQVGDLFQPAKHRRLSFSLPRVLATLSTYGADAEARPTSWTAWLLLLILGLLFVVVALLESAII